MRRASLLVGWGALALFALYSFLAQASPLTIGSLLRLDRVDGGTLPAISTTSEGSFVYDAISKHVHTNNDSVWLNAVTNVYDGGVAIFTPTEGEFSVDHPSEVAPVGTFLYTYKNSGGGASIGLYSEGDFLGTSSGSVAIGVYGYGYANSSATVGTLEAFRAGVSSDGAGVVGNGVGLLVDSISNDGAGSITNVYGVLINEQAAGTTVNFAWAYQSLGLNIAGLRGDAVIFSRTPLLVDSVFANATVVAGTTIGGGIWPAQAATLKAMRFRISVAGTVGSTNATLRASDGTNNCDFSFACNTAAGNQRIAASGSCVFAASASITYTVNSIGNCTLGPTILGNINVEGWLQ